MASKKTLFNDQWLDPDLNPEFSCWLKNVKDDRGKAYCSVCSKTFSLSNMGRQAVLSHAMGPRHISLLKTKCSQPSVISFLKSSTSNSSDIPPCDKNAATSAVSHVQSGSSNAKGVKNIHSFTCKDDVARAEILWGLRVVACKMSLHSCATIGDTFKSMFPDSAIASKFSFGETKCSYVINHGLAPYFHDLLIDHLQACDDYVVSFDESLNNVAQKGQMDLFVRYFDINNQRVCTQYYNSAFLGHATAENLLKAFNEGLSPLPHKNILQVCMDGPNVNLSFLKKLKAEMSEHHPDGKRLLELGVCGLHVVNGAVKTGLEATKWDLHTFLRNAYYVLKDSPSRRADYTALTGSTLFPMKHCSVRWLENITCLERALEIFDALKHYIDTAHLTRSNLHSSLTQATSDVFMKCKLAFFKTIATECQPFLRKFQSSEPLAPFLYPYLHDLLSSLMNRCIKPSTMMNASRRLSIDLNSRENLIEIKKIDLGFLTEKLLKEVNASERDVFGFKLECQKFLIATIKKIREKSPLKYKMWKALTCLDPCIILNKPQLGQTRMKFVLETLHDCNRITDNVAEKAKTQYMTLCNESKCALSDHFKEYAEDETKRIRVDVFFARILLQNSKYSELWQVFKLCLILSHGNASVACEDSG